MTTTRPDHDRQPLGGVTPASPLAERLTAARELRNARDLAASIVSDAEHRAGVLLGRAEILMEEAKAERAHLERYAGLAADRTAGIIAAAEAEHDRLLAMARLKASLIVASARSQASRLLRDQDAGFEEEITIELSDEGAEGR